MSKTENLRRFNRKVRIWEENSLCYWCKTSTVLICTILRNTLPPNAATLDHLYCHGDPRRRFQNKGSLSDTVICCYKCNHARSRIQRRLAQKKISYLYAEYLLSKIGGESNAS